MRSRLRIKKGHQTMTIDELILEEFSGLNDVEKAIFCDYLSSLLQAEEVPPFPPSLSLEDVP